MSLQQLEGTVLDTQGGYTYAE